MIKARKPVHLSPWVTLVEKEVAQASGGLAVFHNLELADYAVVFARTPGARIPIVRQFRPAVETYTWELPGGLVEAAESPEATAARELQEETGVSAVRIFPLGSYWSDTGRLSNRTHAFYVQGSEPAEHFREEAGVGCRFVTLEELDQMIVSGDFAHGLHLAVYHLACRKLGL
jgi:ADP-ribose pyrophosphatase